LRVSQALIPDVALAHAPEALLEVLFGFVLSAIAARALDGARPRRQPQARSGSAR
jgi:hypothetical protein